MFLFHSLQRFSLKCAPGVEKELIRFGGSLRLMFIQHTLREFLKNWNNMSVSCTLHIQLYTEADACNAATPLFIIIK